MKKIYVFLISLVLSLSIFTTGFGYAKISRPLRVNSSVSTSLQDGLFISDVTLISQSSGTTEVINNYAQALLNTTVTLGSIASSTVAYRVTFYNNDTKELAYNSTIYADTAYDNNGISFTVSDILTGDKIAVGETLSLTLTFHYKDNVAANHTLNAVLGFQFGEVVDFEEDKEAGAFDPGENYNALVQNILQNKNRYGLNDSHKGYVIHNALKTNKILYSNDHTTGGNINKLYEALQIDETKNIDFVFEYISETEYVVYLFSHDDAILNKDTKVYKQFFHYDTTLATPKWVASTALLGHAPIKYISGSTPASIIPSDWKPGPVPTA